MKYRLQIAVASTEGPVELLNAKSTVTFGNRVINPSTGGIVADAAGTVINENGMPVTAGGEYFFFGFEKIYYYTEAGVDEADWVSKYIADDALLASGSPVTIIGGCTVVRLECQARGDEELTTEYYYAVVGDSAPTTFYSRIWSHLDLGDDKPAMTYQANDIAELKDRQADYSQALKLPLTAHNLTVLGLPDHVDSQTNFPYTTVECRLYADEYELAGKGAVLVIDAVTDAIECQVLGSSASLFDLLEESPMSDLTEPSFTRDYGGDLVPAAGSDLWPNGFEFVAASFTKGAFHHLLEMNPVYMLPVVNDLYLLGKILEAHGYTWVHNLAGYAGTDKNALPVVTLDPDADSFAAFSKSGALVNFQATGLGGLEYPVMRYLRPLTLTGGASNWGVLVGSNNTPTEAYVSYTPTENVKIRLQVSFSWPSLIPTSRVYRKMNAVVGGVDVVAYEYTGAADSQSYDISVDISKGDSLIFTYTYLPGIWSSDAELKVNYSIQISEVTAEVVPVYGKVHAPRNLGFDTQFDYFKAFVQRYGLTVRVDHATSTVYTYTMKKIYDNKAFARDWSDKLVERGGEMSFRADGYARSNDIAFKDNDEDDVMDKGTFTVADATLDKEKTLFDLPFEAGLDWGVSDKFASVPVFDVPDLSDEITTDAQRLGASEYSGGKPHLLRVSSDTVNLFVTGFGDDRDYHRATHVTAQSLIDTYYAELTDSMLVKAKRRIDRFYLTPADIEAFDPFVPVYIRQYGAYFYVNKISNFIVGRLTSVELIKL